MRSHGDRGTGHHSAFVDGISRLPDTPDDLLLTEWAEAREGRFRIEPLMILLAGIPSYLVVAELALNVTLRDSLPRPEFPPLLRARAPGIWWERGSMVMAYARNGHAAHGRRAQTAGLLVTGASCAAHAILAARGEWITDEKQLLPRAAGDGRPAGRPGRGHRPMRRAVSAALRG